MTALIFSLNPSPFLPSAILTAALVLPFIAYFLAFYKACILANWSRVAMTLTFILATILGFLISFSVVFILFMTFGTHIGR